MDYEVMLEYHKANNADITIAAMPVPIEEASRFGIVITDENNPYHGVGGEAGEPEKQPGLHGYLHIQLESTERSLD